MTFRVLIPTAGTGSRLGDLTRYVNKSLVSIANRPVICHIIEQFPEDAEFVIPLGHKGELVKDFLSLAYPEKTFFFAEVFPFEGTGSGLGLSILTCKEYLQQPFVFTSCDTLVKEHIPAPDHNWIGYAAEYEDLSQYRTVEIDRETIKSICEKGIGKNKTHKPYIGLSGIKDYTLFWEAMEAGGMEAVSMGEAFGLRKIVQQGIKPYCFSWFDTGNLSNLHKTREVYREGVGPNILEKANEAIWFVGNNVIKYSDDENFIVNRVARSTELKGFIPEINGVKKNMYRYVMAKGKILSEAVTLPVFEKLLAFSQNFWTYEELKNESKVQFQQACMKFYKTKTLERVDLFYKNFGKHDGTEAINGIEMPTLKKLFDAVDWNWIAEGVSVRFHGDFHFENILYQEENDRFVFLDWRQEFGGSLTTGDIYYDLAKLLHGLIVCHELIAADNYKVSWKDNEIQFDLLRKQILVECEKYYAEWLVKNGYDRKKVWILTALIYLNIAALHHYPYCLLLYALGKYMLFNELRGELK